MSQRSRFVKLLNDMWTSNLSSLKNIRRVRKNLHIIEGAPTRDF